MSHLDPHVLVMAKAPVSGRVKTRLCPPCTPYQAAAIAEASLADTLEAVRETGAARRVLALDGEPGPWLPTGFRLIRQWGATFAERLANAWEAAGGPGIQIGMDTPQLTAAHLDEALATLDQPGTDAVLGAATDGGWWAIGLRAADRRVFAGVPMSTAATGMRQRAALDHLGLRVRELPVLTDVDTFDDALAVAGGQPGGRFPTIVQAVAATIGVRV